jgi:hypothetical protein
MIKTRVVHGGELPLEDALTHENESVRMFARLASSNATEELADWTSAEFRRPNCQPVDIFIVLAKWSAQTHASMACQFFAQDAIPVLVKMFQQQIESEYREVFLKTVAIVQQRRREAQAE